VTALVLGPSLFLAGLLLLGHLLGKGDRFGIAFEDIDCMPPPGQTRIEFLAEVQRLAEMPEHLRLLDPDLPGQLARAFPRHPWVEHVRHVFVQPPRRVQVELVYRTPVLKVQLSPIGRARQKEMSNEMPNDADWLVDVQGIALPRKNYNESLPLLLADIPPAGILGGMWGDVQIEAAARTAGYVRPHQDRLNLRIIETTSTGLVLKTVAGSRVLWGQPPGFEPADEVSAAEKLRRLIQYCQVHGSLDQPVGRHEHDVRSRRGERHRPLGPHD
jgi:hypothetical protein